jgi:hypothetical protein
LTNLHFHLAVAKADIHHEMQAEMYEDEIEGDWF